MILHAVPHLSEGSIQSARKIFILNWLSFRSKRRKKHRKPKRYEMDAAPTSDDESIKLKNYRKLQSPVSTMPRDDKDDGASSSGESNISMNETRRRMHDLLEDAFSILGPLSKKLNSSQGSRREDPYPQHYPMQVLQPQPQVPTPAMMYGTPYRPYVPPRLNSTVPAIMEPAPAHGRGTAPSARQRRRLQQAQQTAPLNQTVGAAPRNQPVPPVITRDPVVVWDPADRQRYINQRMGYPTFGRPPETFSYTDGNGQGVHITPVQQVPDGVVSQGHVD